MNKFTRILAFTLILAMSAWIATSEQVVTKEITRKKLLASNPNTFMAPYGGYIVDPEWIKVTPESAKIPAGGSQKFTIKVTAPVDASTGNSGVQIFRDLGD